MNSWQHFGGLAVNVYRFLPSGVGGFIVAEIKSEIYE